MHKTREIEEKNSKIGNANIWNWIKKKKYSETQMETFSQPTFCVTFWAVFFIKLLRWLYVKLKFNAVLGNFRSFWNTKNGS